MDATVRLDWQDVVWAVRVRVTRNRGGGLELHSFDILEARWHDRALLSRPQNACPECGKSDIETILRFAGEDELRRRLVYAAETQLEESS